MHKVIVFDFDGVLVESVDVKTDAFAELFQPYGKEVVAKVVKYHLLNGGISRYEKFRFFFKEYLKKELTKDEELILCARFSELVLKKVIAAPMVEGANEFLRNYSEKGYDFFIVSGTPEEELRYIVKERKLIDYFKGVFGSPKSKSELITFILNEFTYKKYEVVMVGDSVTDFAGAIGAGVSFIGRVGDGHTSPFHRDIFTIKDLKELNRCLEQLADHVF